MLTVEELSEGHFQNAYEAVEALRANWLHDRGPLTLDTAARVVVLVYLDNVKLGGVETLRTLPMRDVASMRHLDGIEAQARYGIGHAAGVIFVESLTGPRRAAPQEALVMRRRPRDDHTG